jgi:electron-transferring-flavoprotein dehydrogenase
MPFHGFVSHESVYYLTRKKALRIPAPPTMRNHGNYVASLSQLGRWLAEQAEEAGATILPETSGEKLLVTDGRVRGVRTGDRGRGKDGEPLPKFEPGSDLIGQVTVLAEGTQGHLSGAAISRFGLEGENPQVWALGVKEVWKVAKPLDHVIHTMGWPLRGGAKYREFGGSFIYPMGDEMLTIGMVVGLDYRDVELSVHDLLQELKTHPKITRLLRDGERVAWGAKTIPEGGWYALPKHMHAPGLVLAIFAALQPGEVVWRPGALAPYDQAVRSGLIGKDLYRVRNMRQVFEKGFVRGAAMAGAATASLGHVPHGRVGGERDADQELISTDRSKSYPAPGGKLTFDKLSSVYLSGNKTRDDAPNHIRIETRVPREVAELWVRMCPAQVYEIGPADAGKVQVVVTPSNCVQCGAITAKGGRLTPPEGGAGPEYTLT